MRIGMIVEYFFPPHQRIEKECRSLRAAGHEVHVLCYRKPKQPAHEFIPEIGEVRRQWFPSKLRPFRLLFGGQRWYNRYWLNPIRRFVEAVQPDALHVHDLPLASAARRVCCEYHLPLVLDFHENWPAFMNWAKAGYNKLIQACVDVRGWRRYESQAVQFADRIIVVDPTNRDFLTTTYKVPQDKITVVGNTPELDLFMPRLNAAREAGRESSDVLEFIYIGHIDHGRGLQTVVSALACAALVNARLTIVGHGPYQSQLQVLAKRLGIASRVSFEGYKPHESLGAYLVNGNVGLVPHLRDDYTDTTIPNKIFEYMAAGLPVLASDCIPLRRVIEDAQCGLCFSSGNTESCREALCRMAQSSRERELWGSNGKRAAIETYNWRVTSRELLQMYQELEESVAGPIPDMSDAKQLSHSPPLVEDAS